MLAFWFDLLRLVRPLIAVAISALFALAAEPSLERLLGWRQSVWISVDTPIASEGLAVIATGQWGTRRLPFLWDPKGSANFIYIETDAPILLRNLSADGTELELARLRIDARWKRLPGGAISIGSNGLIELPEAARSVALEFSSSGRAEVNLRWRNATRSLHLETSVSRVELSSNGLRTGWVLVPAEPLYRIELEAPAALRAGNPLVARVYLDGRTLELSPETGPLNVVGAGQRSILGSVIFVVVLGLMAAVALALPRLLATVRAIQVCSERNLWLPFGIDIRLSKWTMVHALIFVGVLCTVFHLAYLIVFPFDYTPDSRTYYGAGRAIAAGWGLEAAPSLRTPGYPLFVAGMLTVFGDGVLAIVIVQHLMLAALGPLTVFALRSMLGQGPVIIAGIGAGCAPLLAFTGNIVWSDSLYALLAGATLLSVSVWMRNASLSWRHAALAGALIGLATLARPNGLMLAGIVLAALASGWWFRAVAAGSLVQTTARAGLLLAVMLALLAPWMKELHRREGVFPALAIYNSLADRTHILDPTSVNQLGWYMMAYYHDRVTPELSVERPFAAFAHGHQLESGFHFFDGLPAEAMYDSRYPVEAVQEGLRRYPERYVANAVAAVAFNLTLQKRAAGAQLMWGDIADVVAQMRRPLAKSAPKIDSSFLRDLDHATRNLQNPRSWGREYVERIETLLRTHTEPGAPGPKSFTGYAAWAMYKGITAGWSLLSLSAFASLWFVVLRPAFRPLVLMWLYVFGSIIYLSLMGFGNDRYMAALEPQLYVLAVVFWGALFARRLESRA